MEATPVTGDLACPTCSITELDPWELCRHRSPICLNCCMAGEHDWPEHNPEDAA